MDPQAPPTGERGFSFEGFNALLAHAYASHRMSLRQFILAVIAGLWPAPGSEDTELGVLMEPEVGHGETEVYPRVQA